MEPVDPFVRSLWTAVAGSTRAATSTFDGLVARHLEPHRRYHGLGHLERVTVDVAELGRSLELADSPRRAALAAAFFHDAVYDPTSAGNEAASAEVAAADLAELGWRPDEVAEVRRLILATARHEACDPLDDPARAVLLDADLAVLGGPPAAYEAYVRGVRSEYAHVSDDVWRVGRPAVLRHFLDAARIYSTAPFEAREARARANLTAELRSLTDAPPTH